MKLQHSAWLLASAVAVPLFAANFSPAPKVSVGDKVAYTFSSDPVNGMGVKSLADLSGKPLLVEFWGTH